LGKPGCTRGFMNDIALEALTKMWLASIDPVVIDWGRLKPDLGAEVLTCSRAVCAF